MGRLFNLIGLWAFACASVWAAPPDPMIENLRSRLHEFPASGGLLIKSFTNHSQSYVYDQALAIIAFTKHGDQKTASALLKGLAHLQKSDGSLYFSYYMDGKSPYPDEGGDKRFAGAIAWVAMSAVHYQNQFRSKEFLDFNSKVLTYLKSQMQPFRIKDQDLRAVTFAPNDIPGTPWEEQSTVALEHNLDAYSAFHYFNKLNPHPTWEKEAKDLKSFILAMWDPVRTHFWSGANIKTGLINKGEMYLDNQSWSLLTLDKETLKSLNPIEALQINCEAFYVNQEKISGFMDSKPTRRPASQKFIWSEGTYGQVLAMEKIQSENKTAILCDEKSAKFFLKSADGLIKEDGGVAYSNAKDHPDFSTASSVAGTAWKYFADHGINPFQL